MGVGSSAFDVCKPNEDRYGRSEFNLKYAGFMQSYNREYLDTKDQCFARVYYSEMLNIYIAALNLLSVAILAGMITCCCWCCKKKNSYGQVQPAPYAAPSAPAPSASPSQQILRTSSSSPSAGPYGQKPGGSYGQAPGGPYGQAPRGPYGQAPGGPYGQQPGGPYGQAPGGQGPYRPYQPPPPPPAQTTTTSSPPPAQTED